MTDKPMDDVRERIEKAIHNFGSCCGIQFNPDQELQGLLNFIEKEYESESRKRSVADQLALIERLEGRIRNMRAEVPLNEGDLNQKLLHATRTNFNKAIDDVIRYEISSERARLQQGKGNNG